MDWLADYQDQMRKAKKEEVIIVIEMQRRNVVNRFSDDPLQYLQFGSLHLKLQELFIVQTRERLSVDFFLFFFLLYLPFLLFLLVLLFL